jgi:glycosyltransferase involved in cell wall biosynthesis
MKLKTDTLVILSPGFAADEHDSTCLPLQQELVLAMNRQFPGVEIILVAFQYPYVAGTYTWNGNKVIALGGQNNGGPRRLLTWAGAWRTMRRLRRDRTLIGVLSFWVGECAFLGHHFARRHGLKHFSWILGQDAKAGNRYAGLLKDHPGEFVALSDFIRDEFSANYRAVPAHTIPPGINPQRYNTVTNTRHIDIIAVGSLIPVKQYHLLVEMAAKLNTRFPGIRIMLCGEGTERRRLNQLIARAGLEQVLILAGERSNGEVLALMQQSRVLLHPSSYEGFGVVCLEALYAGAHVISFCRPQHAWIKHWHYTDDSASMLEETIKLLSTPDLDHTPVLPYSIDTTAREMLGLFGL